MRTLAGTLLFPSDIDWDVPSDFDNEPIGGYANGLNAMFSVPVGLAVWGDFLLVADSANHVIRAVYLATGLVTTLAGTGYAGHIDGVAHSAEFHAPRGISVNGNTLYISDTGNNLIRTLTLQ
jgi:hypothetical protein